MKNISYEEKSEKSYPKMQQVGMSVRCHLPLCFSGSVLDEVEWSILLQLASPLERRDARLLD